MLHYAQMESAPAHIMINWGYTIDTDRGERVVIMPFKWTKEREEMLLKLRNEGKSYKEIAEILGTTISSAKHKYLRLNQSRNVDRHHHPKEKIEQIRKILPKNNTLKILETHAGMGNLTKVYLEYGEVTAHDIDAKKIESLKDIKSDKLTIIKCDSLKQIHRYIYENRVFDVVDLDPYGFPSRFFPHVFNLINDGYLFFTFPKMGVQQINKIMVNHYKVFWDISLQDKDMYIQKIDQQVKRYGLFYFRIAEMIDVTDLDRMYRFAYRVKKESAFKMFGYEHLCEAG